MKILKRTLAALVFMSMVVSICGCADSAEKETVSEEAHETAESSASERLSADTLSNISSEYFDEDDLDTSAENAVEIALNGKTAESSGKGVSINGGMIEITKGGSYILSGTLDNGQVYVDTKDKVHLILDNAQISNDSSSAVFVKNADKAVITLLDGTVNSLSDVSEYSYENEGDNEPDAVIYSKDDLSLNGTGTLNINGSFNEGITTKDDLRIADAIINVKAVGNGIKGKDSLAVRGAVITVDSGSDGIKTSNDTEPDKGYIVFESGTFNIFSSEDAVQADTLLCVDGGDFNLRTGNGADGVYSEKTDVGFFGGKMGMEGNPNKTEDSEKGFKSNGDIKISGGNVIADCGDDAIHSNSSIEITGGDIELATAGKGIHADENISINGGNITVSESYEGIEATVINVADGKLHITASDDGFNASEGKDNDTQDQGFGGRFGGGFGDTSENCQLNISGGYVYVNASGDGLDSNGTLTISGGTVLVDGPVSDGDAALDSGLDISVTGGILIAAGSSGMLEQPSDSSAQCSIIAAFAQSQQAGTPISVTAENGEPILTYAPSKNYSAVIISAPELEKGKTYNVYSGVSCTGESEDGYYGNSAVSGGELVGSAELSQAVTSVGDGKVGQMGGGKGGFGGGHGGFGDNMGEAPEMPEGGFDGERPEMPEGGFDGERPDMPDGEMPNMNGGRGGKFMGGDQMIGGQEL